MPGRKFVSGEGYRFGFNGKETDEDATSGSYDFGARMYNSQLGRWWSVDPMKHLYPNCSPYVFALNHPVKYVDPSGGVVEDPEGNIIFTPTGPETYKMQPGYDPEKHGDSWRAYKVVEGYILDNKGAKVKVELVTSVTVYKATIKNRTLVVDTDSPLEGLDASTNCTGLCFTKGEFILDAYLVDPAFLENEGYEEYGKKHLYKVIAGIETLQEGDIGLYKGKNGDTEHGEVFTGNLDPKNKLPLVNAKGGTLPKVTGVMMSTWKKWFNDNNNVGNELKEGLYKIYNGQDANNAVTQKQKFENGVDEKSGYSYGVMENKKVRVVSESDFDEVQKEFKK